MEKSKTKTMKSNALDTRIHSTSAERTESRKRERENMKNICEYYTKYNVLKYNI